MKATRDVWYVRLPDGRVLVAKNSRVLREGIESGKIPASALVRRQPDEEWQSLEWTRELNDLTRKGQGSTVSTDTRTPLPPDRELPSIAPSTPEAAGPKPVATKSRAKHAVSVSSRLDLRRFRAVDVRTQMHELRAALDTTLTRGKMRVAVVAGLFFGIAFALLRIDWPQLQFFGRELRLLAAGAFGLLVAAVANAFLTQITYTELCQLRPAKWSHYRSGLPRAILRMVLGYGVVVGGLLLAIFGLRHLPEWVLADAPLDVSPALRLGLAQGAAAAGVIVQAALWLLVAACLLLAPAVVIEEGGVWRALWTWGKLVQGKLGRVMVYEGMAATFALLMLLPTLLPCLLALQGVPAEGPFAEPGQLALDVLAGVALAPALAYLSVANVFIYLNLRYE